MRTEPEGLTGMLSSGRRRTRFGLTGVEAESASLGGRRDFFQGGFLFESSRQGLGKVRTSRAGIVSNTSLKQNAPAHPFKLQHPPVTFCLAPVC